MDWDLIKQLLEIVELSRGHPSLKAINDKALVELELIANPPSDEQPEEEPSDE